MGPSPSPSELRRDFLRVFLLPVLTLFIVPLVGWGFTVYGLRTIDARYLEVIHEQIDADGTIDPGDRAAIHAFYDATPPSAVCGSSDPELAGYRESVCEFGSELSQFELAKSGSIVALLLAVFGVAAAFALGLLAYRAPRLQHRALVVGWGLLVATSATEVVLQAILLVWLSFWITALFLEVYFVKLILVAAVLAAAGVWVALRSIFARGSSTPRVEGELVEREAASSLWARLERLAAVVGTLPPAQVIAGIDDNFFVTESPLAVRDREVSGRSLYVSVPLLRLLSATEADAVLAHELGHFRGGDTAESAKLNPALIRYDTYLARIGGDLVARPAFFLMRMFRAVFELARMRSSREREFVADRVSVEATSTDDLARALLKIVAYASHRDAVEQALFEKDEQHAASALALQERMQEGLVTHATSAAFLKRVEGRAIPHPFDSHPPLEERLARLGSALRVSDTQAILASPPDATWVDAREALGAIEERLWGEYEERFTRAHEESLAYRYLPEGDAERAVVERRFPPREFPTKGGGRVALTATTLVSEGGEVVSLAEVSSAAVRDGTFSTQLVLTTEGRRTVTVNLSRIPAREAFKAAFAAYWGRARAAAAFVASRPPKGSSTTADEPPSEAPREGGAGDGPPASEGTA